MALQNDSNGGYGGIYFGERWGPVSPTCGSHTGIVCTDAFFNAVCSPELKTS